MSRPACYRALMVLLLAGWAGMTSAVTCSGGRSASNPDADYVDNGDGTLTHTPSGLTWKRCSEGQSWSGSTCSGVATPYTWANALSQAENSRYGGFSDWRLPNIKELRSLVEECRNNPAINDSRFPATPAVLTWSASPVWLGTSGSTSSWAVHFSHGETSSAPRNLAYPLRLVRRAAASTRVTLQTGWNLLGNGNGAALDPATLFADPSQVISLWKWVVSGNTPGLNYPTWAFRAPNLADGGQAYASGKGYEFLSRIGAGEGFWVHASSSFNLTLPLDNPLPAAVFRPAGSAAGGSLAVQNGWNLIASGDQPGSGQLHAALTPLSSDGSLPASPQLNALWAWQPLQGSWYFWAPSLAASGNLPSYLAARGYLDFATLPTLPPSAGVWVNMK